MARGLRQDVVWLVGLVAVLGLATPLVLHRSQTNPGPYGPIPLDSGLPGVIQASGLSPQAGPASTLPPTQYASTDSRSTFTLELSHDDRVAIYVAATQRLTQGDPSKGVCFVSVGEIPADPDDAVMKRLRLPWIFNFSQLSKADQSMFLPSRQKLWLLVVDTPELTMAGASTRVARTWLHRYADRAEAQAHNRYGTMTFSRLHTLAGDNWAVESLNWTGP